MSLDKYDQYYKKLKAALESKQESFESNSDRGHNTTFLRFMLDTANHVQMFCGEMSVFRNPFYDYINKDADNEGNEGNALKELMIKSLNEFIEKPNAKLEIFLGKGENCYKDLIDADTFKKGVDKKVIRALNIDREKINAEGIFHFSISDKDVVRIEVDKAAHRAICSLNVNRYIPTYKDMFAAFELASKEYQWA